MKPLFKIKKIPEYRPSDSYGANWACFDSKEISDLKKNGKKIGTGFCPDCCAYEFELTLIETRFSLFGLIQTEIYKYENISPEYIDEYTMNSSVYNRPANFCGKCGHILGVTMDVITKLRKKSNKRNHKKVKR